MLEGDSVAKEWTPVKILLAEDDHSVCEMLRMFFNKEKYDVTFAHDGLKAHQLIREQDWDLIILDWMLPGKDGITLCKEIRQAFDTPVIILTAKDAEKDRITGLDHGADDYITKPFSPMELLARIRAVRRRYKPEGADHEADFSTAAGKPNKLIYRDLEIDLTTREVMIFDRKISNLTPKEFDLLTLFIKYPKRVFTREQLLESIWGYDYYGEERTVDVHIKRLRNKISLPEHQLIATVWGVGYKLEE
jgi:two-component system OmpR family response regulator